MVDIALSTHNAGLSEVSKENPLEAASCYTSTFFFIAPHFFQLFRHCLPWQEQPVSITDIMYDQGSL